MWTRHILFRVATSLAFVPATVILCAQTDVRRDAQAEVALTGQVTSLTEGPMGGSSSRRSGKGSLSQSVSSAMLTAGIAFPRTGFRPGVMCSASAQLATTWKTRARWMWRRPERRRSI